MLKHLKDTQEWDDKNVAQKGFTLIELLVVIVILGILAAVVVFAVGGINDKGKKSACKTEGRTFATAVEAYRAKYNDATPAGGTAAAVASTLKTERLLQSSELGYAAGANSWTYTAANGDVDTSGCTG